MSALRTVLIFAAALGLTACATTGARSSARVDPPRPGSLETNREYVAHVETIARRRGIDVKWVNMPVKRTPRND